LLDIDALNILILKLFMPRLNHRYRSSRQRERILELLRNTTCHPTATWVYDQLRQEFPKLSLGNVYRNLNILVENGLIQELKMGSTFDRFDGNVNPHYHFICNDCGEITDVRLSHKEKLDQQVHQLTKARVDYHRLDFYGSCARCVQQRRAAFSK